MAKISAPLLSMGATGTIGKSVVFGKWRGIGYARQRVVPANPQTAEQQLTRTLFAQLREMWKIAPAIQQEPWNAFARGRPFTGFNKYVGENIRVLRPEPDFDNFIGSPGSAGGLPPLSMSLSIAGGADQIAVTFAAPPIPAGWSIVAAQASAFPQQTPGGIFFGPYVAGQDTTPAYEVVLSGLTTAGEYVVSGWLKWMKPDGSLAYSVSLLDTATPS